MDDQTTPTTPAPDATTETTPTPEATPATETPAAE